MSRIGRKPVKIPENVHVEVGHKVSVRGPLGELKFILPRGIRAEQKEGQVFVYAKDESKQTKAFHGLTRSLVSNMVEGVSSGFKKKLELRGIGFRANLQGNKLVLSVGFSHQVEIEAPEGIKFEVAENKITISGAQKDLVGKVAAEIRNVKPPDAYKGKGIRYEGELVRLKPGKAAKAGVGAGVGA